MRTSLLLLFLTTHVWAAAPRVFTSSAITFRFSDPLEHPFIWWPRTLLEYPVRFEGRVPMGQLSLIDGQGGAPVPFQLANVKRRGDLLESATVCFFSDLPSGGTRTFTLKNAAPPKHAQGVYVKPRKPAASSSTPGC